MVGPDNLYSIMSKYRLDSLRAYSTLSDVDKLRDVDPPALEPIQDLLISLASLDCHARIFRAP